MNKLHCIRSPWHRLLFSLFLWFLLLINWFISPRARAHWVGYHRRRRPERLLAALGFLVGFAFLKPYQFTIWSMMIGGALAIFLNLYTIYRLLPWKRTLWVVPF